MNTKKAIGDSKAGSEERVPLSVREARRARTMRDDVWPYMWMSFASVVILAAALAIVSYRMGDVGCRREGANSSW